MPSTSIAWNEKSIALLCKLWAEGISAGEIGRLMGLSKNAVLGKAHRLNLPARPSPIIRNGAPASLKPQRLARPPSPTQPCLVIPIEKIRGTEAELPSLIKPRAVSHKPCCWPLGDPKQPDFHFCNARAQPARPYCAAHESIAWVKRDRREDAA